MITEISESRRGVTKEEVVEILEKYWDRLRYLNVEILIEPNEKGIPTVVKKLDYGIYSPQSDC